MTKLTNNIKHLTNEQLLQVSDELRQTTVADDALLRQVIKDTEHDTTIPMLAFIAVQGLLSFELAYRLKKLQLEYDQLDNPGAFL